MKNLFFYAIVGLLLIAGAGSSHADELLETYTARLSKRDHYNSSGTRLTSAAAIIRQDRANFHKFNKRDPEDENDRFFASADNRALMERQLNRGRSNPSVLRAIVRGTPLVQVSVYRDDQTGQDYVQVVLVGERYE